METTRPPASFFFKGQFLHALLLAVLLGITYVLTLTAFLADDTFAGWSTRAWFIASLAVPIAHQLYVWIGWRSQLCFGAVTNLFGSAGFSIYGVGFMLLFALRAVVLIALGCVDFGSLGVPMPLSTIIAVLFAIPAAYTFYSVMRYFSISRAMGIDHFDPTYHSGSLVKRGIFRFTGNAMYTYGFLLLWSIAFACCSQLALISAIFSHAYIWVHYLCTERTDMIFIYGETPSQGQDEQ
ncbi:MAG: hypothetical protein HON53_10750 [Planctomycetaceae bacterium]|jgi:hypothetical protein|nr:hypothetical protein [Planctomycetaceae bacterium]MBT6155464.1 hypothetical protein [Planctomycetaceae bacterium]MBT6483658.1 hypothetical protein [Planctomycetaceae bacterium]MBT6497081.1 hypothetical protein [Planctomycetaceae bacterium]